jgi:predicted anti-sigma-YlaC factor YlaD
MDCTTSRELISADLDGEASGNELVRLDAHLDDCSPCRRFAGEAALAHRAWRIRSAPAVPDLSDAILAAGVDAARAAESGGNETPVTAGAARGRTALRLALAGVAATQLALAGPALVRHADFADEQHAAHHLDAWAVAFAVGLLVAAWQPWRVRGLLPLAATLGAVMAFTVGLDMANRHAVAMPATAHLIELAGLILLWALARTGLPPEPRSAGRGPAPAGAFTPGALRFRAVAR